MFLLLILTTNILLDVHTDAYNSKQIGTLDTLDPSPACYSWIYTTKEKLSFTLWPALYDGDTPLYVGMMEDNIPTLLPSDRVMVGTKLLAVTTDDRGCHLGWETLAEGPVPSRAVRSKEGVFICMAAVADKE